MNRSMHPEHVNQPHSNPPGDIAIVGMACRFPGAPDADAFWRNLAAGACAIGEIPPERWDRDAFYSPVPDDGNTSVSKWGGFIDGIDQFDAGFFGITATEAQTMDPQQRMMLELAWSCFEDAGHAPATLSGTRTGVYIGGCNFEYAELLGNAEVLVKRHFATGTYASLIPNRISHFFNLQGPSIQFNTACSSSLAALHDAVHALQRGDCTAALVGGICLICTPTHFISYSKMGLLSPDGRCLPFDQGANGLVRGEGAGMVMLKPLAEAQADGDRIYGVIRATAVNHGGRVRGLTYPNPMGQAQVIADAHLRSGVAPDTISYMELHGTATPKGDAIEIEGLTQAFRQLSAAHGVALQAGACGIGSLKSNIGHSEGAAGMAGLIKVLLCMKHQTLPGLANFSQLNPAIELDDTPFYIVRETQPWAAPLDGAGAPLPRRAGVSSFGFGGLNAHVVLEEYVAAERRLAPPSTGPLQVFLLSAKNEERLRAQVLRLLDAVRAPGAAIDPASLAYTLQVGRDAMAHRLAIVADSIDTLAATLDAWLAGATGLANLFQGQVKRTREPLEAEPDTASAAMLDLLPLWVDGLTVDWQACYRAGRPARISLPTYAFARERYWIPTQEVQEVQDVHVHGPAQARLADATPALHPMLHRNTSDLSGPRFSTTLRGDEAFLKCGGNDAGPARSLPRIAHLEMAHAAAIQACGGNPQVAVGMRLKHLEWAEAVRLDGAPITVHLGLHPKGIGEIAYQIYTDAEETAEGQLVHSHGVASMGIALELPTLDLHALRAGCSTHYEGVSACRAAFEQAGGAIEQLHVGAQTIVAQLALDVPLEAGAMQLVLHPALLHAALQATAGWGIGAGAPTAPITPVSLQELVVAGLCTARMWAVLRRAPGGVPGEAPDIVDIDLCDADGAVRIRMKGLGLREQGWERAAVQGASRGRKDVQQRAYLAELVA